MNINTAAAAAAATTTTTTTAVIVVREVSIQHRLQISSSPDTQVVHISDLCTQQTADSRTPTPVMIKHNNMQE